MYLYSTLKNLIRCINENTLQNPKQLIKNELNFFLKKCVFHISHSNNITLHKIGTFIKNELSTSLK